MARERDDSGVEGEIARKSEDELGEDGHDARTALILFTCPASEAGGIKEAVINESVAGSPGESSRPTTSTPALLCIADRHR